MDGRLTRIPLKQTPSLNDARAVRASIAAARERGAELDLGLAWAALHFLIAAEIPMPKPVALERGIAWSNESLENVLMGGRETAYGASFGPARYLAPREVARFSARLDDLGADEITGRYDAAALEAESIPPGSWEDDAKTRSWLHEQYLALVDFYRGAAASGDGLVLYMV